MNGTPPNTEPVAELTGAAPPAIGQGASAGNQAAVPPIAEPVPVREPAPLPAKPAADGAPSESGVAAGATGVVAQEPTGVGVLLVNLGTPDAATPAAVRRYLKEFLSDRRVIENNSVWWKLLLNAVILPIRSRRKARDYRNIWNNGKNESPFKTITRSQAEKLAGILEPLGKHVIVDWAMRYASPSIASRLQVLTTWGCERILIMPLYPQYSAATTATVCDEVYRFMMRQRRQPALRILPAYYDDPYYIEVLASSLKAELKNLPFTPDVIVASYHGMPKDYVAKGDPYESQCVRTTELLRAQDGARRDQADHDVPVALRPRQMARALHHQYGQGAGQEGRQESGRGHAGIFRRLPGDAGRDRGR